MVLLFVLQDLTLKHGWRTGAIIPELRKEIKIMNTEEYVHMVAWSQALTGLIEQMQVREKKIVKKKTKKCAFLSSDLNILMLNLSHFHTNRFSVILHIKLLSRSGSERGKP